MVTDHPMLILENPVPTKAVCLGHRAVAAEPESGMVAVFAVAKTVEPCQICIEYEVPEPALTLMRVSYWFPSRHPSMRDAIAMVTAVFPHAEVLPGV